MAKKRNNSYGARRIDISDTEYKLRKQEREHERMLKRKKTQEERDIEQAIRAGHLPPEAHDLFLRGFYND